MLKCICHTSSRIASLLGKYFCFPRTSYDSACPKYIPPEGNLKWDTRLEDELVPQVAPFAPRPDVL